MKQKVVDHLEKQLEKVNYWLSFAEAKNAAIIVFNVTLLTMFLETADMCKVFVVLYTSLMLLSTAICLYTFLPNTKNKLEKGEKNKKGYTKKDIENLMFWGDIARYDGAESYLGDVHKLYFPEVSSNEFEDKRARDLSSEIFINSNIATKKYKCFRFALYLTLLSMLILLIDIFCKAVM